VCSSDPAARQDLSSVSTHNSATVENVQSKNGHVMDFSFRNRFEKIDWRKIGTFEWLFLFSSGKNITNIIYDPFVFLCAISRPLSLIAEWCDI